MEAAFASQEQRCDCAHWHALFEDSMLTLLHLPGDDELLETDNTCHELFQRGEFQRRQEVACQLHGGLPGSKALPFLPSNEYLSI